MRDGEEEEGEEGGGGGGRREKFHGDSSGMKCIGNSNPFPLRPLKDLFKICCKYFPQRFQKQSDMKMPNISEHVKSREHLKKEGKIILSYLLSPAHIILQDNYNHFYCIQRHKYERVSKWTR